MRPNNADRPDCSLSKTSFVEILAAHPPCWVSTMGNNISILRHYTFLVLLLFIFSCSVEPESIEDEQKEITENLLFSTNQTTYSIGDTVQFTIFNETDSVFYFYHCYDKITFTIDINVDDSWETFANVHMFCDDFGSGVIFNIDPGNSYHDMFTISVIDSFRLVVVYRLNQIQPIADYLLFSNVFNVQ